MMSWICEVMPPTTASLNSACDLLICGFGMCLIRLLPFLQTPSTLRSDWEAFDSDGSYWAEDVSRSFERRFSAYVSKDRAGDPDHEKLHLHAHARRYRQVYTWWRPCSLLM